MRSLDVESQDRNSIYGSVKVDPVTLLAETAMDSVHSRFGRNPRFDLDFLE